MLLSNRPNLNLIAMNNIRNIPTNANRVSPNKIIRFNRISSLSRTQSPISLVPLLQFPPNNLRSTTTASRLMQPTIRRPLSKHSPALTRQNINRFRHIRITPLPQNQVPTRTFIRFHDHNIRTNHRHLVTIFTFKNISIIPPQIIQLIPRSMRSFPMTIATIHVHLKNIRGIIRRPLRRLAPSHIRMNTNHKVPLLLRIPSIRRIRYQLNDILGARFLRSQDRRNDRFITNIRLSINRLL